MSALTPEQQELYDWVRTFLPGFFFQDGNPDDIPGMLAVMFDVARATIDTWVQNTYIQQGTGSWLDVHARDRNTRRQSGESDDALRDRLRNVQDLITVPALEAFADSILTSFGTPTGAKIVSLRRDRAFLGTDPETSRARAYCDRGYRVTVQAYSGTPDIRDPDITVVASGIIMILPFGTTTAGTTAIQEMLRISKAGGFYSMVETRQHA